MIRKQLTKNLREFLRIKNYSQHTIENYERDINEFFLFTEKNKIYIENLESNTASSWLISLRKKGLSNRSIHRKISSLRNFFRYLQRNSFFEQNIFEGMKVPKIEEKLPKVARSSESPTLRVIFKQNFTNLNSNSTLNSN